MLHILEKTDEGRNALQEVLGPLQHLQYLQRTVRQHELDLDALSRSLEERPWGPSTAFGLRYHAPHGSSSGSSSSSRAHRASNKHGGAGSGGSSKQQQHHHHHKPGSGGSHGSFAAAVAAANAAAEAARAAADVAAELAGAGRALRDAKLSGGAAGDGSSTDGSGGHSSRSGGDGIKSSDTSSSKGGGSTSSRGGGGSSHNYPRLRLREKVVRGSRHTEELQAELTRRKDAVSAAAEALRPRVEAMMERLRDLLRAAANSSGLAPTGSGAAKSSASGSRQQPRGGGASGGGSGGTGTATADLHDIVADPSDLDLYDLILPRCVLARLDPTNYVSYPARPFVSVVLSYSGRRLPYALYEVAEPLLACAAGLDLPPWPGQAEGGPARGGDDAPDGGALGGEEPLGKPLPPLPLEILVAFDQVSEAAGWAAAAADSGGRIIPVFRPGVEEVHARGSINSTAGGGHRSSSSSSSSSSGNSSSSSSSSGGHGGGSAGWSGNSPPPLVHWANRVAQLASGEVLVVVQDGASLLSPPADASTGAGSSTSSTSRRVCSWLHMALRAFEARPQLGALGSGAYVMDWHPASVNAGQHFWDGERRLPLQFVAAALASPQAAEPRGGAALPAAPVAVRRAAWRQLGGLDAGLGTAAACGACVWLDLSARLWMGGWQVGQLPFDLGSSSPAAQALLLPLPALSLPADSRQRHHRLLTAAAATAAAAEATAHAAGEPGATGAAAQQGAPEGAEGREAQGGGAGGGQPAVDSIISSSNDQATGQMQALLLEGTPAVQAEAQAQDGQHDARALAAAAGAVGVSGPEEAEDAAWCERPELAGYRGRLEGVCARVLQLRYGASPYWHDGSTRGPEGGSERAGHVQDGVDGDVKDGVKQRHSLRSGATEWPAAWFLGSDVHVLITQQVRQLNLRHLSALQGWPGLESACPFGAAGCSDAEEVLQL
ncbi:hypothetical protein HYH02_003731 [Chlamydomonas schloesseri]|uniref:Uncharacterized protein n=1 Tax=Chlamydomonas schloesseri TaxID=2026947 RepID=A0A836B9P6_9CHLO|nr:hypothetical protein HYH02_003731 [Chlamydomonas schloesseri]|eukprot:KAG2451957.1 hypothetical protein HYH02_003731 [Chlamydomonas schloesseri]